MRARELREDDRRHEDGERRPLEAADGAPEDHAVEDRGEDDAQLQQDVPERRRRVVHREEVEVAVDGVEQRRHEVEERDVQR